MRSEEKFGEIFGYASEKAVSLGIRVPTVVPGQERKRKVPVRFQHSPTVSQVGAQFESVEAYFRSSVYFTFLDTMTEELNRRFKGDNTGSPTARIIQSFHSLTVHANWVSTPNAEAKEAVHILCDFYGEDEDQLKTELKVFHSSFPAKDLKEIFAILRGKQWAAHLSCLCENDTNLCNIASDNCLCGEIIFKAENYQKQTKKSVWRRTTL